MGTYRNAELELGDLPSYVRRSFKGGAPKKLLLKPGMMLFTVSHKPTFGSNAADGVPAFWSPYKAFHRDRGFDARADLAKGRTQAADEVFTNLSAFYGRRPGGRYAIVAKLKVGVYGFFGPIRRQGRSAAQIAAATGSGAASGGAAAAAPGSGKNLIGYHIYVPGLAGDADIRRVRKIDLLAL